MAGSQADITHRKEIEAQLTHRTLHDELTGLSNRTLFFQRLAAAYEKVRRDGAGMAAVFFIDIDQFKAINDALGHLYGDGLLTAFSQRLTGCMGATDTIARFGGDEFAALVENVEREEEALQTAERICADLSQPFHVLDTEISASASIGIAFLTARSRSIDELMRDVDRAMYHAKRSGRARFEVFHPSMHDPQ
jgi:diguanylate cyclase (GGDEF)-like protein